MTANRNSAVLGMALVVLELLAAMQSYVSSTVTPLLAAELGGRHLYGMASGCLQAAMFLTLPLSPALVRRWGSARVLVVLTPVAVLSSVGAAVAGSMEVWIGWRAVGALCSGAMAGVGMGIIAAELTGRVRQLVLAANSVMWVMASLVGPGYAAWISSTLSWRWALVAHLPLLVAARWVIVSRVRAHPVAQASDVDAPLGGSVLLAASVLALGVAPPTSMHGAVGLGAGLVGLGLAIWRVLPRAVLRGGVGAVGGIHLLWWLSLGHFGADGVVAIVAHDLLGFGATRIGALLMLGGLAWSLVGVATGAWPASPRRARWQLPAGVCVMAGGLALCALACTGRREWLWAGWMLVNLGMGLAYLDCLNLVFGGARPEGLAAEDIGMAAVLVESIAGAVAGTLAASLVAGAPARSWMVFAVLAALVLPGVLAARRALAG